MWRDWEEISKKIGIFIGLTGLVISLFNLGLYYQFNQDRLRLNEDIANLEQELFQLTNFNTSLFPTANQLTFLEPSEFMYSNDTIKRIVLYGKIKIDTVVVTPHYGNLSYQILWFNPNDTPLLDKYKQNDHKIEFLEDIDLIFVQQGLNHISLEISLKATIFPDSEIYQQSQADQFILGYLRLAVDYYDLQGTSSTSQEFSTDLIFRKSSPAKFPIP